MHFISVYDFLKLEYDNYEYKIDKMSLNNNKLQELIQKLYDDNVFVNLIKLKSKIDKLIKCVYLEFVVDNLKFKIQLLLQEYNEEIYKKIHFICFMMKKIFPDFNNFNELSITAYLYDHPRTFKNAKTFEELTILNNFNCPSGYTQGNKIILTRINGFYGLLIHELLHFFKSDGREIKNYENYDLEYKKIFNKYIFDAKIIFFILFC